MTRVTLVIQSRKEKELAKVDIDTDEIVLDLKKQIHGKHLRMPTARQRLTLPLPAVAPGQKQKPTVLQDDKQLKAYGLQQGSVLILKDLGPQVAYSLVFIMEYLGPMLVYPLFYFFPRVFYPNSTPLADHYPVQKLALIYWTFHYAKRILETLFVHKFSHGTMPLFNLFKNCSYYWGFAAFVSFFVNHPLYTPPNLKLSVVALALAMVCQLGNFWCHVQLANLRAPGEKDYKIPRGLLFNFISCPNYTCETLGWILYGVATHTVAAFLFIAAGGLQMAQWARQKHNRMIKQFDGKEGRPKYPKRWIMLPPVF